MPSKLRKLSTILLTLVLAFALGIPAPALAAQEEVDHGDIAYGPWEVGSPNAADVTATIYEDGTMVFACADGVESSDMIALTSDSEWYSLPWTPTSFTATNPALSAIKRVEFGEGVMPTSLA